MTFCYENNFSNYIYSSTEPYNLYKQGCTNGL